METTRRIKQITFLLGIVGFVFALFLCAQTLGMGMETDRFKEISSGSVILSVGSNTLSEITSRYSIISLCFLLFIMSVIMRDRVFLKAAGVIPLIVAVVEGGFLVMLKTQLFKLKWQYSNWLEITYYIDLGFFTLAVVLLVLQIYLIRFLYHLPVYNDSLSAMLQDRCQDSLT